DRDWAGLGRLLGVLELECAAIRECADGPDVHDLVLDLEPVLEALQLRDAHVKRSLPTLEPVGDAAAGTCLLALGTATGGLALAGGDATADARAWLARPGGRLEVVEFHDVVFSEVSEVSGDA